MTQNEPVCIYGHFNRHRGFGVQDYYPQAKQFLTILRDPLDMALSHYFFVRNVGATWQDQSRIPTEHVEEYMLSTPLNMLNHFPRPVTRENYREIIDSYFIYVGLSERLQHSMQEIASRLGFSFDPTQIEHLNKTEWDFVATPSFKEQFEATHALEVAVYEYAKSKFHG